MSRGHSRLAWARSPPQPRPSATRSAVPKVSASTLWFPWQPPLFLRSFSYPQSLCHLKRQVSLFFILKGEKKWVGARGLAGRMRTEKGFLECSHRLPPNKDHWAWDCPQGPPQQLLQCDCSGWGAAQAGESRLRKLAGPKSACCRLSSPTSALCLDGIHLHAPRSLLLGILPFPRPGLEVVPQEVPADVATTPSDLLTSPLYLLLRHPTFLPDGLLPCGLGQCLPHSMSEQGHRRPRGTWGRGARVPTTIWPPALPRFAPELYLPPMVK